MYKDRDRRVPHDSLSNVRMGRRRAVALLAASPLLAAIACREGESEEKKEFKIKDRAVQKFAGQFITEEKREEYELSEYFGTWQMIPRGARTQGVLEPVASIDPGFNVTAKDVSYIKMRGSLTQDFMHIALERFGLSAWDQLPRVQEYEALEAAARGFIILPQDLPVTRTIIEAPRHLTAAAIQAVGDIGKQHVDFSAFSYGRFNLTVTGLWK